MHRKGAIIMKQTPITEKLVLRLAESVGRDQSFATTQEKEAAMTILMAKIAACNSGINWDALSMEQKEHLALAMYSITFAAVKKMEKEQAQEDVAT